MLQELFSIQNRLAAFISRDFQRSMYQHINWNKRLITIVGARGTGKTTLVLQHYLTQYNDINKCLYISADNPLVLKSGIYKIAQEYFKYYGNCLIVDEVHKHKDWSVDIKALYDAYPDKQFIILGSSVLNILFEKGDLSRRAIIYKLYPLSFREFLHLWHGKQSEIITISQLLENHVQTASKIMQIYPQILKDFKLYLECGSYPYILDHSPEEYFNVLSNTLDKVIYEDITTIKALKMFSASKLKSLLAYIATSKIPLFNIENIRSNLEISRDTIYDYFNLLKRAEIIQIIPTISKKVRAMKHSKILFASPNIYYAIAHEMWKNGETGNVRESFFASQLIPNYPVFSSMQTDFIVMDKGNPVEIEVGGRNKKKKQIKNIQSACIFKDGIETGHANVVPLYLAGFLY